LAAEQGVFNGKRNLRNLTFVANVVVEVASNRHVTIRKLAQAHGVSTKMIHATLNEDLNLSKKSARWVPKLLTEEMKNERVKTCEAF
jgi:hypothetical protein